MILPIIVVFITTILFLYVDIDSLIGGITSSDNSKGQTTRLIDVFLLGPFMIWYGTVYGKNNPLAQTLMISAGTLTTLYNGRNYINE